jgi:hypothetical protein
MMMKKNDFNPQCLTFSQMNLIFNARIYYRRLTTWTRAYVLARYFGVGTAEELFGRLYLESLDIGDMFQFVFGRQVAEQYSQLAGQFAIAFRDLISAQLDGNTDEITKNVDRLYQNVAKRSIFLEELNPYWSAEGYRNLFGTYIQYIIEIANAIAAGDYSRDIELYDRLTAHTNRMGDVFAQGMYNYITSGMEPPDTLPANDSGECITYEQMEVIYNIRMVWFELFYWVRNYMLSRYVGLGNVDEVFTRLQQVSVDYTNALKQVFGEQVAEDLLQEINLYFVLLGDFITAQMEGNTDELDRVTQLLYENAEKRAALISSVNPLWDFNEWRTRLFNNTRITIDESTTFLTGDYARNIDIFSRLLDLSESTSTYFAQGIYQYLSQQSNPSTSRRSF